MIDLPYQTAKAGQRRESEIRETLRDLGAGKIGFMQDYDSNQIICQFELGGRQVSVYVGVAGYARAWLDANPWSSRRAVSSAAWEKRAWAQAEISVWAVMADWIKAQATMIYIGALDFDTAFLAHIHIASPDGRRMIEVMRDQKQGLLPPPGKGVGQ